MEEKNLEDICFDFQQALIKVFNEGEIPFLLKYYLTKEIWNSIQNEKNNIDTKIRNKYFLKLKENEKLKNEEAQDK